MITLTLSLHLPLNNIRIKHELESYSEFTKFRLIYESNRIEKAGLSEGDTKNLILGEKSIQSEEDALKEARELIRQVVDKRVKHSGKYFVFEKKKRSEREVLQHYLALVHAKDETLKHKKELEKKYPVGPMPDPNDKESSNKWFLSGISIFMLSSLFSDELIREIHAMLAYGLLPRNAGVPPGFYREGPVHVDDPEVSFVSWENVPRAMHLFVYDANETMHDIDMNPIMKAAKISYDFVGKIHPFPDFNGRLSRIIINMVLQYHGLPFFAALRGDAKEKHRYIWSLKRANHGDLNPYACLIARAVNRGFEELNRNLETAGLEPIKPISLPGK